MIVFSGNTSNGVKYEIDDQYFVDISPEEVQKIIDEQRRIAHDILVRYTERNTQKEIGA